MNESKKVQKLDEEKLEKVTGGTDFDDFIRKMSEEAEAEQNEKLQNKIQDSGGQSQDIIAEHDFKLIIQNVENG